MNGSDTNPEPEQKVKPGRAVLYAMSWTLFVLALLTWSVMSRIGLIAAILIFSHQTFKNFRRMNAKLHPGGSRFKKVCALTVVLLGDLCLVGSLLYRIDAAPVENDYTVHDLKNAAEENLSTYSLLLQLAHDSNTRGIPAIGLTENDLDFLSGIPGFSEPNSLSERFEWASQHGQQITSIWKRTERGKAIINTLNEYPQIADLSSPSLMETVYFTDSIKYLGILYLCRVLHEVGNESGLEAVESILLFDEVMRKLGMTSRAMTTKLVCYGSFARVLYTLNMVVQHPDTSDDILRVLQEKFSPYTTDQLSLRNSLIFEYLSFQQEIGNLDLAEGCKRNLKISPFYKENSTRRFYKNCIDYLILMDQDQIPPRYMSVSVWPWRFNRPRLDFYKIQEGMMPWYYTAYNPIGSMLTDILRPALNKVSEIKKRMIIIDDLFRIVLALRLDRQPDWTASYYEDHYHVDLMNRIIYSVGPDGKAFTRDDISLPIEPAVLGLTQENLDFVKN